MPKSGMRFGWSTRTAGNWCEHAGATATIITRKRQEQQLFPAIRAMIYTQQFGGVF